MHEPCSAEGFPALVKVIVVMSRQSVMADSLELAFEALQQKMLTTEKAKEEM